MKRLAVLVVALGLVPSSAGAVTLVTPDGQVAQPYQRWADAAKVPTVAGTVTVYDDDSRCGDAPACASPASIWIDRAWFADVSSEWRPTLLHELGHQFDFATMTDAERERFQALIHDHRQHPWVAAGNSPSERFAEAYSLCARPRPLVLGRVNGAAGYSPLPRTHERICALIRRAGGWYMQAAG